MIAKANHKCLVYNHVTIGKTVWLLWKWYLAWHQQAPPNTVQWLAMPAWHWETQSNVSQLGWHRCRRTGQHLHWKGSHVYMCTLTVLIIIRWPVKRKLWLLVHAYWRLLRSYSTTSSVDIGMQCVLFTAKSISILTISALISSDLRI